MAKYNYGFLFKKSSLPKSHLNRILQLDDFTKITDKIIDKGKNLDDLGIYNIVSNIYFPMLYEHQTEGFKEAYKEQYGTDKYKEWSFKFRLLGQATKNFSKVLFDNPEQWEDDYSKFCNK